MHDAQSFPISVEGHVLAFRHNWAYTQSLNFVGIAALCDAPREARLRLSSRVRQTVL
jgi:hypothetical protein